MTAIPFLTRSARRLALLGATAAIALAAVSLPQAASARVVTNPG